jgi:hypothetical protein
MPHVSQQALEFAAEPLCDLSQAVQALLAEGQVPQIVFDLDDTLFLVKPRKRAIFHELAASQNDLAVAESLRRLAGAEIPYDVREALESVGIGGETLLNELQSAFFERFFDGRYTRHDEPNMDAAAYVRLLKGHGVRLVYLSGRPEDMRQETLEMLSRHGFPLTSCDTEVVLKQASESHLLDPEFKALKALEIAEHGPILAFFDNEPANLNAMQPASPGARCFLLDTDHSPNPPVLAMSAFVIRDFKRRLAASLAASPHFTNGDWSLQVELEG